MALPIDSRKPSTALIAGGILVLCWVTALAYIPALRSGFVWDDDTLVTNDWLLRSAQGLRRIWSSTDTPDYWPVTMTSFWLQFRLWGLGAAGYHAVSVGLHAAEALLLWAVLGRMRVPGAYVAAFLFAVHPVNVETVAWISEQKNLLAMLFLLGSTWWFLGWGMSEGKEGCYALSLGAFVLGMLSKGSVAVLPLVFLGIIAWCRPVTPRDLLRLAPFFVVVAALAAVDVWFQRHGTSVVIRQAGWLERLLGAAAVIGFYLGKAVWPWNLTFIYPQWDIRADGMRWWLPLTAVAAVTAVLWVRRKSWSRPLLFGWGFYCVALLPVMGFVDVYFMKYSLVADHYQHIAIIGVVALAGAGWSRWVGRGPGGVLVAAAVIGCLSVATYRQCRIYRDAETLYRATISKNHGAWIAETNLGLLLFNEGRVREAIPHYEAALASNPDILEADNDLGLALAALGRLQEAGIYLDRALALKPNSYQVHYNRGLVTLAAKNYPEAAAEFSTVERLRPDFMQTEVNLGDALEGEGRPRDAVGHYGRALRQWPDLPNAEIGMGRALFDLGRPGEAAAHFENAIRENPNTAGAHLGLGRALAQLGRIAEARSHFLTAMALKPGDPLAKSYLDHLPAQ